MLEFQNVKQIPLMKLQLLRDCIRDEGGDLQDNEIAEAIGISPSTLSRFLKGDGISLENFESCCCWLDVSMDEFRGKPFEPLVDKRLAAIATRLREVSNGLMEKRRHPGSKQSSTVLEVALDAVATAITSKTP